MLTTLSTMNNADATFAPGQDVTLTLPTGQTVPAKVVRQDGQRWMVKFVDLAKGNLTGKTVSADRLS